MPIRAAKNRGQPDRRHLRDAGVLEHDQASYLISSNQVSLLELSLRELEVPDEALLLFAALTDRAQLDPKAIEQSPRTQEISFPIIRYPLLKRRTIRPNVHDLEHPLDCLIAIRRVRRISVENQMPSEGRDTVTLLFGIQVHPEVIELSSAEETRGQTLFRAKIEIEALDLKLKDR